MGLALAATGTHPWANYLDQRIIDTEHYRRLEGDLRWVAQRNNTWSLHVHVGVRGARPGRGGLATGCESCCPPLLALSANSPFLDHRDTRPHSVRTEIFTRTFPRCGVPEPFGDWRTTRTSSSSCQDRLDRRGDPALVERPPAPPLRHRRGPDLRRPDQRRRVAHPRRPDRRLRRPDRRSTYDEGTAAPEPLRQREIEENLWRAIRYGMDGEMIDFRERRVVPTRAGARGAGRLDRAGAHSARASRWSCRSATAPSAPSASSPRAPRSRRSTGARSRRPARPTRRRERSVADEDASMAEAARARAAGERARVRASRARRSCAPSSRRRSARSRSRT